MDSEVAVGSRLTVGTERTWIQRWRWVLDSRSALSAHGLRGGGGF